MAESEQEQYEHLYGGAFCVYSGQDPETGETLVLLLKRGKRFHGTGLEAYGMPGGHIEVQTRIEQPREAAVREFTEEIRLPDDSPVLTTITTDRLAIVDDGIDYGAGKEGTLLAGVHWTGYRCALTPSEVSVLKDHIAKMKADPDYAAAVREATHQETADVLLVPAADVPAMLQSGEFPFAYAHERKVLLAVAQTLVPPDSQPRKRLAF